MNLSNPTTILSFFKQTFILANIDFESLNIIFYDYNSKKILYKHISKNINKNKKNLNLITNSLDNNGEIILDNLFFNSKNDKINNHDIIICNQNKNKNSINIFVYYHLNRLDNKIFISKLLEYLIEYTLNQYSSLPYAFSPNIICQLTGYELLQKLLGNKQKDVESLFMKLNEIANLRYEGSNTFGSIVFFKDYIPQLSEILLKKIVKFSNTRGIRKLLEISRNEYFLIAKEDGIFGLLDRSNKLKDINIQVDFYPDGSWVLIKDEEKIYQVYSGIPRVFQEKFSQESFESCIKINFPYLKIDHINTLYSLISNTVADSKGTNILITQNADEVVLRLQSQCTIIEPILLSKKMLNNISRIDGTVIINPQGVCFGFGAILDGDVSINGNRARGGRYNSAVMYTESCKLSCVIVVISQDGSVDLITSKKSVFNN